MHIITSVYLLYHLGMPVWAEGYQRASANLRPFIPIIVLNVFYKAYFKFTIYFINYAIAKSIVWQLEAWETISESRNGAFDGRMTGPVRENGTEYCINNSANAMAVQVSYSSLNGHSCSYQR